MSTGWEQLEWPALSCRTLMGARGGEEAWKVSTRAHARLPPASLKVRAEIPLSPLHNPRVQGGRGWFIRLWYFLLKANFNVLASSYPFTSHWMIVGQYLHRAIFKCDNCNRYQAKCLGKLPCEGGWVRKFRPKGQLVSWPQHIGAPLVTRWTSK